MGLSAARVSRSPDSRRSPSSNPASLRGTPKGSEMRVAATAAVVRLDNSGRVPTHRGRILGHTDDAPTTGWWMKEVYGLHAASRWSCSRESAQTTPAPCNTGRVSRFPAARLLPGLTSLPDFRRGDALATPTGADRRLQACSHKARQSVNRPDDARWRRRCTTFILTESDSARTLAPTTSAAK